MYWQLCSVIFALPAVVFFFFLEFSCLFVLNHSTEMPAQQNQTVRPYDGNMFERHDAKTMKVCCPSSYVLVEIQSEIEYCSLLFYASGSL